MIIPAFQLNRCNKWEDKTIEVFVLSDTITMEDRISIPFKSGKVEYCPIKKLIPIYQARTDDKKVQSIINHQLLWRVICEY